MKVNRDAFSKSFLQRNSNELLSKAIGLVSRMEAELMNTPVGIPSRVKGLPDSIDPNQLPHNYRDAMQREDRQEWAEAYDKEFKCFIVQGTIKIACPEKGLRRWTPPRVPTTRSQKVCSIRAKYA
jgi:hypothetical protein